jgi:hypothetical protein
VTWGYWVPFWKQKNILLGLQYYISYISQYEHDTFIMGVPQNTVAPQVVFWPVWLAVWILEPDTQTDVTPGAWWNELCIETGRFVASFNTLRLRVTKSPQPQYYHKTSIVLPVKVDGNEPFLCLTVIQSVAASCCKSHCLFKIYKISLKSKSNVKTSSRRQKADSCQTHQHKTDRLSPDSSQTQTPPDPTIASFAFLATRVATVRT